MSARRESQQSISRWASETFGEPGSLARVAARANEELAEMLRAYTAGQPVEVVAEEAADTAIVLCRLGERMGVNVEHTIKTATESSLGDPQSIARLLTTMGKVLEGLLLGDASSRAMAEINLRRLGTDLAIATNVVLGFALWPQINAKMGINRGREWKTDGSGHGYHNRSGEDVRHA